MILFCPNYTKVLYLKFSEKKLLLFDFDGTLIDSAPDLALAINHTLKSIGHKAFSQDTIRSWVGNGAQTLVKRALSGKSEVDENIDEVLFKKALDIFLSFYAQNVCVATKAYPNVKSTLEKLKNKGYRLTIVTNKPYEFIEPILEGLELDALFELLVGGDTLAVKKPNPEPLLYVCEKLDVTTDETLMIGDSKNDILAAHAASIQSIGVSYGYNYGEDIGIYKPDLIVDDFADILKSL